MSEYWKSTPKYWCDHCKVYVRDSKLEKANHENTGKHQSALAKFLRNIHKDNEREERDKQRAKDEVARLSGAATSSETKSTPKATVSGAPMGGGSSGGAQLATAEERKRQIAQLAAMGVAVPEEYRRDMAMVGDWEVVSKRQAVKNEPDIKGEGDSKYIGGISGTKRAMPDSGVDEEEPGRKRVAWGSATKSYKGDTKDDSLEALLGSATGLVKKERTEDAPGPTGSNPGDVKAREPAVKVEPDIEDGTSAKPATSEAVAEIAAEAKVAADDDTEVVFKKRKSKPKR